MLMTLKGAAEHWAQEARAQVTLLEQKIKEAQADIRLMQENHARLHAELAIYEAKKESL